jgi:hypothetical protein
MWKYKTLWDERVKALGVNLSALDETDWHIRNDKFVLNETDGRCLAWKLRDGGWIPYIGSCAEVPEKDDEYLVAWHCTNEKYSKYIHVDILEWTDGDGFIDTLNRSMTVGGFEIIAWQELPKLPTIEELENE